MNKEYSQIKVRLESIGDPKIIGKETIINYEDSPAQAWAKFARALKALKTKVRKGKKECPLK